MAVQDRKILREKAIALRKEGFSYSYIHKDLELPRSTLSDWLKMIPFTPNKITLERIANGTNLSASNRHQKKLDSIKEIHKSAIKEIGVISSRDLWLFGIGLYLGEGTKMIESVRITNSDPRVIKIAVKWFVEVIGLTMNNLSLALHSYPDNNIDKDMEYWSSVSGIPIKQFGKTQIDIRKEKHSKHKLPHGTVQLRVLANGDTKFGVSLHRRILGWVDAVAG
ncbi:MAG: hypothetical protein WA052_03575 [Microgenomates group bacterium]